MIECSELEGREEPGLTALCAIGAGDRTDTLLYHAEKHTAQFKF